jgi:hypothetical protein
VSRQADRWIRWTTTGCVGLLALIAGTVSYLHMHTLVALHGQPGWVAALTPLSVDGMIVAASTALLVESRSGGRGGLLPWGLLVTGSVASLAANVAVAEPTVTGRVIAAWPSFALIGSYELLMRQVRRAAESTRAKKRARGVVGDAGSARPLHRSRSVALRSATQPLGLVRAGTCNGRRGCGRGPTGQVTVRFLPAKPSPTTTVGKSAGVGWSSRLAWRAGSQPTTKPPNNRHG